MNFLPSKNGERVKRQKRHKQLHFGQHIFPVKKNLSTNVVKSFYSNVIFLIFKEKSCEYLSHGGLEVERPLCIQVKAGHSASVD